MASSDPEAVSSGSALDSGSRLATFATSFLNGPGCSPNSLAPAFCAARSWAFPNIVCFSQHYFKCIFKSPRFVFFPPCNGKPWLIQSQMCKTHFSTKQWQTTDVKFQSEAPKASFLTLETLRQVKNIEIKWSEERVWWRYEVTVENI